MAARPLNLGLIGMSEGNGHPYSWAAICNGYDVAAMKECPFPAISEYLARQKFPRDQLRGARVTHVWTPRLDWSRQIARASKIPKVVNDFEEMLGVVDAVLVARDDAEQHEKWAQPFLNAGVPIYLDKPAALSLQQWKRILKMAGHPSLVFSCSALRYSSEMTWKAGERKRMGKVLHATAVVPKRWDRYAVHVLEPIVRALQPSIDSYERTARGKSVQTHYCLKGGASLDVIATGESGAPILIQWIGTKGVCEWRFTDSFTAFRAALHAFVLQVRTRRVQIPRRETQRVVEMIAMGLS